ncbi:DUF6262 family protein [Clostridium estertheticum]|uniref:DUF6262 family protein n=1 Tax=Clostridium estertheticum TaxID=238834 RepID=UPI001C0B57A4|nr:DUF6262 family protein [Clostridium estertheticum]MBU3174702.1 transposase [Clostridium estertheticum]
MNNKRNTEAIVNIAKKKSDEVRKKVEKTIQRLILEGVIVNFNVVKNEAGVSKSWLYSNEDIRQRIEEIRDKQNVSPKRSIGASRERSEASKDNIITALKERIKELDGENKKLRKESEILYGRVYKEN